MLGKNTEIVDLPTLRPGAMVNCVLSEVTSDVFAERISAVVAVAIGDELGCVVEASGKDKDPEDLKNKAKDMVEYMMDRRGVEIRNLIVESSTMTVSEIGSVVSAVVYVTDDIKES